MAQLGLVEPLSGRESQRDLQKKWYAKLASSGFKDLEWVDHKTGLGHNSPYLKGSLASGKPYHAGRDLYYSMATNYLMHAKGKLRGHDRLIWKMHAEGETYEGIRERLGAEGYDVPSLYTLFYDIQRIAAKCHKFNLEDPEGLVVKRAEDREALEALDVEGVLTNDYDWITNGGVPGE